MYLWNHGINPTEKYKEKETEERVEEQTPELKDEHVEEKEEIVQTPVEEPIIIKLEEEPQEEPEGPIILNFDDEEEKKEPLRVKPRKKIPVMEDIDSGREEARVRVNPEDLEEEFEVVYAPLEIEEKGFFARTFDKI